MWSSVECYECAERRWMQRGRGRKRVTRAMQRQGDEGHAKMGNKGHVKMGDEGHAKAGQQGPREKKQANEGHTKTGRQGPHENGRIRAA
jgi:hypothetical protein